MHKYRLVAKKGEGTFSEVLKAQSVLSGQYCAVKCMKNHFKSLEQVNSLREIQALRRLNPHPNVIELQEVLYDKQSGRLALVFELMDQNIYEMIRNRKQYVKASRVKLLMYQLIKSVAHMHKHGIFHRDIKPENILILGDDLKVADFGSCRGIYTKPPYTEYISTRWYRAPECLLTSGYYDYKMDIWGIGCVFFEIVSLFPLFPGTNEFDQIEKVHNIVGTPPKELMEHFKKHSSHLNNLNISFKEGTGIARLIPHASEDCISLIEQLLIYDPEKRITAKQALRHPYFRELREAEHRGRVRSASPNMTPEEREAAFRREERRKLKMERAKEKEIEKEKHREKDLETLEKEEKQRVEEEEEKKKRKEQERIRALENEKESQLVKELGKNRTDGGVGGAGGETHRDSGRSRQTSRAESRGENPSKSKPMLPFINPKTMDSNGNLEVAGTSKKLGDGKNNASTSNLLSGGTMSTLSSSSSSSNLSLLSQSQNTQSTSNLSNISMNQSSTKNLLAKPGPLIDGKTLKPSGSVTSLNTGGGSGSQIQQQALQQQQNSQMQQQTKKNAAGVQLMQIKPNNQVHNAIGAIYGTAASAAASAAAAAAPYGGGNKFGQNSKMGKAANGMPQYKPIGLNSSGSSSNILANSSSSSSNNNNPNNGMPNGGQKPTLGSSSSSHNFPSISALGIQPNAANPAGGQAAAVGPGQPQYKMSHGGNDGFDQAGGALTIGNFSGAPILKPKGSQGKQKKNKQKAVVLKGGKAKGSDY